MDLSGTEIAETIKIPMSLTGTLALDIRTTANAETDPEDNGHTPAHTQDQGRLLRAEIDIGTTGAGGNGVLLHMLTAIHLTSDGG